MNDTHDASATVTPPPGPAPASNDSLFARVKNVFAFETSVYDDVAAKPVTVQAIVVIALASVLSGSFLTMVLFFVTIPFYLFATAVNALLVSFVAKLFSKESPEFGAWFRALGFAEAPLVLGVIPFVGSFIAGTYVIATSIAAIHRVARIPIGSAILTWLIAWLLPIALIVLLVAFLVTSLGLVGLFGAVASGM